ncbi:hypothetical protein KZC51_07080 [Microbacterium sp. SSW1-49]|uniref:Uncharacterized protein n=1 Tax=Microbacterium croceum TaxID=2851645 RepID=A0ABT0FCY8_9MICO|nr:hypothetical protein [Microbacterium croceum]MCK2035895.1 hypothetical protein [Microbacterium croceum]
MDVLLDREHLRDAHDTLKTAKHGFEDAGSINDTLESASWRAAPSGRR